MTNSPKQVLTHLTHETQHKWSNRWVSPSYQQVHIRFLVVLLLFSILLADFADDVPADGGNGMKGGKGRKEWKGQHKGGYTGESHNWSGKPHHVKDGEKKIDESGGAAPPEAAHDATEA
ncbi:hypothetical protein L596_020911 [Steinernema carpocapsae]|uniref:Uncharacterized protein n=1 Tax=Steinernema carpocapsae TaxID=34508 RepID=A0A4U5MV43_STECR|nr:hypothetical protein L596_020911 [Steinernema carpocapsae]